MKKGILFFCHIPYTTKGNGNEADKTIQSLSFPPTTNSKNSTNLQRTNSNNSKKNLPNSFSSLQINNNNNNSTILNETQNSAFGIYSPAPSEENTNNNLNHNNQNEEEINKNSSFTEFSSFSYRQKQKETIIPPSSDLFKQRFVILKETSIFLYKLDTKQNKNQEDSNKLLNEENKNLEEQENFDFQNPSISIFLEDVFDLQKWETGPGFMLRMENGSSYWFRVPVQTIPPISTIDDFQKKNLKNQKTSDSLFSFSKSKNTRESSSSSSRGEDEEGVIHELDQQSKKPTKLKKKINSKEDLNLFLKRGNSFSSNKNKNLFLTPPTFKVAFTDNRAREEADAWLNKIKEVLGKRVPSNFFEKTEENPKNEKENEFCLVEHFNLKGLRITGNVSLKLLALLSTNINPEDKWRDARGWFVNRNIPLSTLLNLFDVFGWELKNISECVSTNDKGFNSLSSTTNHNDNFTSIGPISICSLLYFVKKPLKKSEKPEQNFIETNQHNVTQNIEEQKGTKLIKNKSSKENVLNTEKNIPWLSIPTQNSNQLEKEKLLQKQNLPSTKINKKEFSSENNNVNIIPSPESLYTAVSTVNHKNIAAGLTTPPSEN